MMIKIFIKSKKARAETMALVDCGAMENFMNLGYAKSLGLPIKTLEQTWSIINVDGTENKDGELKYYMDVPMRTGQSTQNYQFFLTNLGTNMVILGYPWFSAEQPQIDWKHGWMDYEQLLVIIRMPDAG